MTDRLLPTFGAPADMPWQARHWAVRKSLKVDIPRHCDVRGSMHLSRGQVPVTMSRSSSSSEVSNVTCPFCGLACDDLVVGTAAGRLAVRANGCPISLALFERGSTPGAAQPRVGGKAATLEQAVGEAARLLREARQPLVAGLGTDVAGARAATRLAERCRGVLDHMNSTAAGRNALVVQDSGWITTTLSEVRNRADLVVVAASDIPSRFPRFFERCLGNRETMFGAERQCEVVLLGLGLPDGLTLNPPAKLVPCEVPRLQEAFAVLRALVAGRALQAREAAGVPLLVWQELADRMLAAHYGVIAWAAADLDFPHAELTVQVLCELIKDLNRKTRFAGLPLGGTDGDLTVDAVLLWQTGFGSRTSYARGYPEYDPYHYSTARLLQTGEADVLLWISSFNEARTPPSGPGATVALGRPGMNFQREPEVFIPVGTPGIDHAGCMFRSDRVVALPLRRLREAALPGVAEVLGAIEGAL